MNPQVLECHSCGAKTGDPEGALYYVGRCPQCSSANYKYRKATSTENILMKLHLMKIYKK